MGKLCVYDPEKISKVCFAESKINIFLSKKGIKHFKKAQKIYEKRLNVNNSDREKFSQLMKASVNAKLSISPNDVKSAVCTSDNGYDQLVILHSNDAIINKRFNRPILPIAIKKGGCDKIVKKSFLKEKIEQKEVFLNTAKNEIANLSKRL